MFEGRINRLGYLIGALYLALPLFVVIVAYVLVNIMISSTSPAMVPDNESLFGNRQAAGGSDGLRVYVNVVLFIAGALAIVFSTVAGLGLMARRWHDMGQTGWLTLLTFLPFVGWLASIALLFIPSTSGRNQYGDEVSLSSPKDVLLGSSGSSKAFVPTSTPAATAPRSIYPEPTSSSLPHAKPSTSGQDQPPTPPTTPVV